MDRKVKHRILGIFVVIALVVILLPFFQSGKDVKTQTTLIKAPPFPDQSVQVTATPTPVEAGTPQSTTTTTPGNAKENSKQETVVPAPQAAENGVNLQPDEAITSSPQPSAVNDANDLVSPVAPAEQKNPGTPDKPDNDVGIDGMQTQIKHDSVSTTPDVNETSEVAAPAKIEKVKRAQVAPKMKKAIHHIKTTNSPAVRMQSASAIKTSNASFSSEDLFKLKNTVWVIQMGSFKNKTNALRLVNQLRARGYRAFIQQINTASGDTTRVFVGPENKQASARALASQLETHTHVHGIVISYQPLAL